MANPNYPSIGNLEQTAEYRPGVASRLINVLTGGIAGAVTGSTQMAQEAQAARRALLQEELSKRDEERMMGRQIMIEALRSGLETPTGGSLEEMMADLRAKKLKQNIIASEATRFGLGQAMGPSQYEANPLYQSYASAAQTELARRGAELRQTRDINAEENRQFLLGLGVPVPENATAGQLEALRRAQEIKLQSEIPFEQRGQVSKAGLKRLQGLGAYPSPIDVSKMTAAQAIAEEEPASKQYAESKRTFAFQTREQAESNALKTFNQLLSTPNANKADLQAAYYNLGKDEQKNEEYRIAAGVQRPASSKENEALDKYRNSVDRASALAQSIQAFVGSKDIANASRDDFNGFKSWVRKLENKYGAEDPRLQSINNVVQEFQRLIAEQRKDFFGASLTDNEFEVAKQLFADPNQANFLPRVLSLVDSIMSKDEINRKYTRRGIFVDAETRKEIDNARNQWFNTKSQLNFGGKTGGGAAPAGTRVINMDRSGNRIK